MPLRTFERHLRPPASREGASVPEAALRISAANGDSAAVTDSAGLARSLFSPRRAQAQSKEAALDAFESPQARGLRFGTGLSTRATAQRDLRSTDSGVRYEEIFARTFQSDHFNAVRRALTQFGLQAKYANGREPEERGAEAWAALDEGGVVQVSVLGLSATNGFSPERKGALVAALRDALRGTDCRIFVSPETVLVSGAGVDKGSALAHFARTVGVPATQLLRFGDRPEGIDGPMLDAAGVSFNVGDRPAPAGAGSEWVGATNAATSAKAVLSVLDRFEGQGLRIPGLVVDFDGTVSAKTPSGAAALDDAFADRLLGLLRASPAVPVAVITGRGVSIVDLVVGDLRARGATSEELKNLAVYMYNGAVAVRG